MSNELPSDLIYNIIESIDDREAEDELNNGSNRFPSTLTACSLVSHAWNDICRPHIFRTITIDHGVKWHSRLSFLYFTAPHLSKYIRTLRLSWDTEIHTAAEWIPACLKQLENLDGLYLRSHLVLNAPTVPMPFALGVITLTAHIKRLWLETWDVVEDASDLLPLLSACSATLERLTLRIYSVSHLGTIPQRQDFQSRLSRPVRLEALRKLELLEGLDPLPHLINIECPSLESLTVELDGGDGCKIPSWIPAGIHELNLRVVVGIDVPLLDQSTHLSSLSISISHAVYHSYHPVITWIGTFSATFRFLSTSANLQ